MNRSSADSQIEVARVGMNEGRGGALPGDADHVLGVEDISRLSSQKRLPSRFRDRIQSFRVRRRLILALGRRRRFGLKAKLIAAALLFLFSFSVKSLHAVDLAPTLHTNEQLHSGMAGEY